MSLLLGLVYGLGFSFLSLFGFRMLALSIGRIRSRARLPDRRALDPRALPRVTVQLPIYNERYVAARAIAALCRLRWPADRLEIQVLDDSDDETCAIIDAAARSWRARGIDLQVIRRGSREGFKAGALAHGLARAKGDALAIFDADFVPPADFLEQALPYLVPGVAAVQARWGHLNAGDSLLTRAQALALDGHFLVEQTAQSRLGLFLNFNGTAGVWCREAIDQAGGWQGDTLTEDFDLSYRAQLAGWRIAMLPDLVAPAELPGSLPAYRRQQHRWAKGTVQVLRKLGRRILSAEQPGYRRVLALLTLSGYLVHPVMLCLLLAAPLLLVWPPVFPAALSILTLAPFCPPIMYAVALAGREPGWPRRLLRDYPALALLTMGMALAGTRAVAEAVAGRASRFERTPKEGDGAPWLAASEHPSRLAEDLPALATAAGGPAQGGDARGVIAGLDAEMDDPADPPLSATLDRSDYRLPLGRQSWVEAALAVYAWAVLAWAWKAGVFWLAAFCGLYALGFSLLLLLALRASWPLSRGARKRLPAAAGEILR